MRGPFTFVAAFLCFFAVQEAGTNAQMLQAIVGASGTAPLPALCPTPPALVASTTTAIAQNGGTSAAIDTTGATEIDIVAAWSHGSVSSPSISDNKSNTYTVVSGSIADTSGYDTQFYKCVGCTVGAGHTFSFGNSNVFGGIIVAAFSGTQATVEPSNYASGANGTTSTQQPGIVTPLRNCELVLTASAVNSGTTLPTTPSGYTSIATIQYAPYTQNAGLAYKVQTTATVENPTWTGLGTANVASIALSTAATAPAAPNYTAAQCSQYAAGCDEAWSVTHRLTSGYSGALLKVYDGSATHDIPQAGNIVDMTALRAVCSFSGLVSTNCVYASVYAQKNTGSNDFVPSTINPGAPAVNCGGGGTYKCAPPVTLSATTGLPNIRITTTNQYQFNLLGTDAHSTGITSGTGPRSLVMIGAPIPLAIASGYCCGEIGIHGGGIVGSFNGWILGITAGTPGVGLTNCSAANKYCMGLDANQNDPTQADYIFDYASNLISNMYFASSEYDATNGYDAYFNGIHLGNCSIVTCGVANTTADQWVLAGGSDQSQPTPVDVSDIYWVHSNSRGGSEDAAALAVAKAFYRMAVFP